MIVFSAIVPHSPLLLPVIGKERQKKLKKTLAAYAAVEQELYAAKPECLVIFTPHGGTLPDALPLFISPKYTANLKEFGDFKTTVEIPANPRLIEALRRLKYGKPAVPLQGVTEEFIDYGVSVPLYFLVPHLPGATAVAIGDSHLSVKAHAAAGAYIGDELHRSSQRVAVIASADLSQALTDDAPGGFSPEGKLFDEAVVQALRKGSLNKILTLESKMEAAKACGLRVIALLVGMLREFNCTPELLAYEGPFGVGYLTAKFNFR
ncbi:hypothetical protein HYW17_04960 [Candidatus Uhrbacteria bacterium]|nr:hypothetical protein [Candidatus Uhrbacteria bacterium]